NHGQPRDTDAAVQSAPQQGELDPAGNARRSREAGRAPSRIETDPPAQWEGAEDAEHDGETYAQDGEAQRRARVAQGIVGGGVETYHCGCEQPDGGAAHDGPDIYRVAEFELPRNIEH